MFRESTINPLSWKRIPHPAETRLLASMRSLSRRESLEGNQFETKFFLPSSSDRSTIVSSQRNAMNSSLNSDARDDVSSTHGQTFPASGKECPHQLEHPARNGTRKRTPSPRRRCVGPVERSISHVATRSRFFLRLFLSTSTTSPFAAASPFRRFIGLSAVPSIYEGRATLTDAGRRKFLNHRLPKDDDDDDVERPFQRFNFRVKLANSGVSSRQRRPRASEKDGVVLSLR